MDIAIAILPVFILLALLALTWALRSLGAIVKAWHVDTTINLESLQSLIGLTARERALVFKHVDEIKATLHTVSERVGVFFPDPSKPDTGPKLRASHPDDAAQAKAILDRYRAKDEAMVEDAERQFRGRPRN